MTVPSTNLSNSAFTKANGMVDRIAARAAREQAAAEQATTGAVAQASTVVTLSQQALGAASGLGKELTGAVTTAATEVADAIAWPYEVAKAVVGEVVGGTEAVAGGIAHGVESVVGGVVDGVESAASAGWHALESGVKTVASGIENAAQTVVSEVTGAAKTAYNDAVTVGNGATYNRLEGRLRVATGRRQGAVRLEVENDGPVVEPAAVPGLFERFHRRSDQAGGHGLGLAIVHAIVTTHRGSIHAEARPGGGLRVEVLLPAATGAA